MQLKIVAATPHKAATRGSHTSPVLLPSHRTASTTQPPNKEGHDPIPSLHGLSVRFHCRVEGLRLVDTDNGAFPNSNRISVELSLARMRIDIAT